MAADFEGLVSSKSIFKILDMSDQINEETQHRRNHYTFHKNYGA